MLVDEEGFEPATPMMLTRTEFGRNLRSMSENKVKPELLEDLRNS
jgi:hypothetical protein